MKKFEIIILKISFCYSTLLICCISFGQNRIEPTMMPDKQNIYISKQSESKKSLITYDKGDILLPYDKAEEFRGGISIVSINKKYGCINETGKLIIDTVYNYIEHARINKFLVVKTFSRKKGVLGINNKLLIDTSYNEITTSEFGYVLEKERKEGFADEKGKIVLPIEYERVSNYFKDGLASLKKNSKFGFYNKKGEIKVPIKFDKVENFNNKLALVITNRQFGYVDINGKILFLNKYEIMKGFEAGLAPVMKNNKWGLINTKGEIIVPLIYNITNSHNNGLFVGRNNEEEITFNAKGKIIERQPIKEDRTIQSNF